MGKRRPTGNGGRRAVHNPWKQPSTTYHFPTRRLLDGAGRTDRAGRGPLGWKVPLVLGLVGVVGAAIVGGPVADRRVGGVAVGLALLAAVAEEALFRRVLYDRLLRFGVVVAVAGSAGLFALVHLPAYGLAAMPVDFGAALLLGWQR